MTASREFLCCDLPVAGVLSQVREASRSGAVVVTAPPGSGKTMLVPAAVLDDLADGMKLILLQPRRIAARAVAQQIAILRGVPLGGEVGYQVRFDSCTSRDTRLFVETTGIMLRRLLTDISLRESAQWCSMSFMKEQSRWILCWECSCASRQRFDPICESL